MGTGRPRFDISDTAAPCAMISSTDSFTSSAASSGTRALTSLAYRYSITRLRPSTYPKSARPRRMTARKGVRLDSCWAVSQPMRATFGAPCALAIRGKVARAIAEAKKVRRCIFSFLRGRGEWQRTSTILSLPATSTSGQLDVRCDRIERVANPDMSPICPECGSKLGLFCHLRVDRDVLNVIARSTYGKVTRCRSLAPDIL